MEDVRDAASPGANSGAAQLAAAAAFSQFVLSTCSPSHVRAARRGADDWTQVPGAASGAPTFASPSTGQTHACDDTCQSWVLRLHDGVRVCAISGKCTVQSRYYAGCESPLKRTRDPNEDVVMVSSGTGVSAAAAAALSAMGSSDAIALDADTMDLVPDTPRAASPAPRGGAEPKRHQDRPIPGSSVALAEKFSLSLHGLPQAKTPAPTPRSPAIDSPASGGGGGGGGGEPRQQYMAFPRGNQYDVWRDRASSAGGA